MIAERIDQSKPLPPMTAKEVAEFYAKFREPIGVRKVKTIEDAVKRKLARLPECKKLMEFLVQERSG